MPVLTLKQLADMTQLSFQGDPDLAISGVASLSKASNTDLSFVRNKKYYADLLQSSVGAVVLSPDLASQYPSACLISLTPEVDFYRLADLLLPKKHDRLGCHLSVVKGENCQIAEDASIGPHVVLGENVRIGSGVTIGAHCVIGDNVEIQANTQIKPQVTIYDKVVIGESVLIHSGVVIGSDGFGNLRQADGWTKIPHMGGVIIHDQVEIGANTTIDRGTLDDTIIGRGVRLDNLIHIAHNVVIGENTVIAACVGIAGSARIGRHCLIAGGCGINGHIEITDNVILTGMAMVTKSIDTPGVYSSGTGLLPNKKWRRMVVRFRQLDTFVVSIQHEIAAFGTDRFAPRFGEK